MNTPLEPSTPVQTKSGDGAKTPPTVQLNIPPSTSPAPVTPIPFYVTHREDVVTTWSVTRLDELHRGVVNDSNLTHDQKLALLEEERSKYENLPFMKTHTGRVREMVAVIERRMLDEEIDKVRAEAVRIVTSKLNAEDKKAAIDALGHHDSKRPALNYLKEHDDMFKVMMKELETGDVVVPALPPVSATTTTTAVTTTTTSRKRTASVMAGFALIPIKMMRTLGSGIVSGIGTGIGYGMVVYIGNNQEALMSALTTISNTAFEQLRRALQDDPSWALEVAGNGLKM